MLVEKEPAEILKGLLDLLHTQDRVLNSAEAAEYLRITERHLKNLRDERKVSFSQDGKLVRFMRSDLDAYLNKNKIAARQSQTAIRN